MCSTSNLFFCRCAGRQAVSEEYIRRLGQFVEDFLTAWRGHIDPDAALAPIGLLDQRMAVGVDLQAAHPQEATLSVTTHGVLDLDDLDSMRPRRRRHNRRRATPDHLPVTRQSPRRRLANWHRQPTRRRPRHRRRLPRALRQRRQPRRMQSR